MALNGGTHMQKTAFYRLDLLHTPCRQRCGRWIIHVFLTQAVSTTIFSLTVGLFSFFGLPISSLGLAMIFSSAGELTCVTTVGLAPKATPANTKR
jgi:hypothetical protein